MYRVMASSSWRVIWPSLLHGAGRSPRESDTSHPATDALELRAGMIRHHFRRVEGLGGPSDWARDLLDTTGQWKWPAAKASVATSDRMVGSASGGPRMRPEATRASRHHASILCGGTVDGPAVPACRPRIRSD